MLKIAEYNQITGKKIDLKELEKYGFEYRENYLIKYLYNLRTLSVRVELDEKTFYVSVNNYGKYSFEEGFLSSMKKYKEQLEFDIKEVEELFNDLIKDGLVEKVENK